MGGCTSSTYTINSYSYNSYYRTISPTYNYCSNGYNYYYDECCDWGWYVTGITVMWLVIFGLFCAVIMCIARRKR